MNIAHRGGALEAPENTIYAFKKAVESGADWFEMDIRLSSDGVLLLCHDPVLERTTDGSGEVSGKRWEELKRLDAAYNWNPESLPVPPLRGSGITMPSLEEIFERFPSTPVILEIKPNNPRLIELLGRLIEKYDRWDRTIAASFHHGLIRRFRKMFPAGLSSAGRFEIGVLYFFQMAGLGGLIKTPAYAIQIPEKFGPFKLLSRGMIRTMHKRGVGLHVWTVNTESDMRRMIDMGIDGILTDRPSLLARITGGCSGI